MRSTIAILLLLIAPFFSLLLTTLTYALRELSRVRLAEALGRRGKDEWYEPTLAHGTDLAFITGATRLGCNTLVLLALIDLCRNVEGGGEPDVVEYLIASVGATMILIVFALALPRAIANEAGEEVVARCIGPLHTARRFLTPITRLAHAAEHVVIRARPNRPTPMQAETLAEEEILEAVSVGETAGIVDDRQRELIESVMEFRSATVDEVMTLRPQIVALPVETNIDEVLRRIEETGHSRIPIYADSVDKIVGVLYARDLLKHLGEVHEPTFDMRKMLRTPLYVPRTKLLRDVLQEFRLQKVHIAIVLDEYGGTAGLITIEDVVEQLVGEISDEHEPVGPTMFKRLDDNRAECDARIEIQDLNRLLGLSIPEDDDYETLGGYVTKALQRIPAVDATFDAHHVRFTVLEAAPARVIRVRVEALAHAADAAMA